MRCSSHQPSDQAYYIEDCHIFYMTLHFSGTGAGDKGDPGPQGPKGEKGESAPLPSGPISKQKD